MNVLVSKVVTDGTASLVGGALTGLTNLTVDNININGSTITHSAAASLTIVNTTSNQDIVFGFNDGGVSKNIRLDAEENTLDLSGHATSMIVGDDLMVTNGVRIGDTTEPTELLQVVEAADNNLLQFDTYSATNGHRTNFQLRKSDSNTLGTMAQTDSGDTLGQFDFQGVDTGSNFDWGALIFVSQTAAAGVRLPSSLGIFTYSSTAQNSPFTVDSAGELFSLDTIGATLNNTSEFALYMDSVGHIGPATSALKAKKNIRDLPDSNRIYNLRPVKFDFKGGDKDRDGLIAEEVESEMPEIVRYKVNKVSVEKYLPQENQVGRCFSHYETTDEPAGIHYDRLMPAVLDQIQKLNERVKLLEN